MYFTLNPEFPPLSFFWGDERPERKGAEPWLESGPLDPRSTKPTIRLPHVHIITYMYNKFLVNSLSHFLLFQPDETHLISSAGGLFTPEQVAANIVAGIKV